MAVHIRSLMGGDRTFTVRADPNDTVESLKVKIFLRQGAGVPCQSLIFGSAGLANDRTLGECGVEDGAEILVHYRF